LNVDDDDDEIVSKSMMNLTMNDSNAALGQQDGGNFSEEDDSEKNAKVLDPKQEKKRKAIEKENMKLIQTVNELLEKIYELKIHRDVLMEMKENSELTPREMKEAKHKYIKENCLPKGMKSINKTIDKMCKKLKKLCPEIIDEFDDDDDEVEGRQGF
jgi:hypothetical protein